MENCSVCKRIDNIITGTNPYFVTELETGYVVLGDYQFYKGYTVFICKKHVTELHQLETKFKNQFLKEMSEVGKAVFKTFKPRKLNYELLGNTDEHLHWHIFPRYQDDPKSDYPTWCFDEKIRKHDSQRPSQEQLLKFKDSLLQNLREG